MGNTILGDLDPFWIYSSLLFFEFSFKLFCKYFGSFFFFFFVFCSNFTPNAVFCRQKAPFCRLRIVLEILPGEFIQVINERFIRACSRLLLPSTLFSLKNLLGSRIFWSLFLLAENWMLKKLKFFTKLPKKLLGRPNFFRILRGKIIGFLGIPSWHLLRF